MRRDFDKIAAIFTARFGYGPEHIVHAPGRVNIIGDHTDYNDGFVLPAAINFGTDIAVAKRQDRKIRVFAQDCDESELTFCLDDIKFDQSNMWVNYVAGSLKALAEFGLRFDGADIAVTGNVPQGAGLSSSASFEIALLRSFSDLYQLELTGVDAAKLGQLAENQFVGCNCGIMDQLISAMGRAEHAMLLDCRSLTFENAPLPQGYSLFIVNSNVQRGLVDSAYNERRAQCEQVAKYFEVKALRQVSLAELESAKSELSKLEYKRAYHVIAENDRTQRAFAALKQGDIKQLASLMVASHRSLRDDFETSTTEMDCLVDLINNFLQHRGGARMTGGGFGGCVVALVPEQLVPSLTALVEREYPEQTGLTPKIYTCLAVDGAFSS